MKKQLFFLTNENGFSLPYVLFIITISFVVITTNIKLYYNEISMTHHQTEQIKIETLIQMGIAKFRENIKHDNDVKMIESDSTYTFPSGSVEVNIISQDKSNTHIRLYITTDEKTDFTIKTSINF